MSSIHGRFRCPESVFGWAPKKIGLDPQKIGLGRQKIGGENQKT